MIDLKSGFDNVIHCPACLAELKWESLPQHKMECSSGINTVTILKNIYTKKFADIVQNVHTNSSLITYDPSGKIPLVYYKSQGSGATKCIYINANIFANIDVIKDQDVILSLLQSIFIDRSTKNAYTNGTTYRELVNNNQLMADRHGVNSNNNQSGTGDNNITVALGNATSGQSGGQHDGDQSGGQSGDYTSIDNNDNQMSIDTSINNKLNIYIFLFFYFEFCFCFHFFILNFDFDI